MSKRSRHQMAGSAVLQHLHACMHQEPTTLMVRAVDEERAAEFKARQRTSARATIAISLRVGAGALVVAVACALIVGLVSRQQLLEIKAHSAVGGRMTASAPLAGNRS
jgi:hypothetical protein